MPNLCLRLVTTAYPFTQIRSCVLYHHEEHACEWTQPLFDHSGQPPTKKQTNKLLLTSPQEPSLFTGSYVHDRFPDATESSFAVAFRGASWTDPDSIPLMVMQTMLGESSAGDTGRMGVMMTAEGWC